MKIYDQLFKTDYIGNVVVNNEKDFGNLRLHKRIEKNGLGDITRIRFYKEVDASSRPLIWNEEELVIDKKTTFIRSNGVLLQENSTIDYYRKEKKIDNEGKGVVDGEGNQLFENKKVSSESYSVYHEIEEGLEKNRVSSKRVLQKIKREVMTLIGKKDGKELLKDVNGAYLMYIEGNRQPLIDEINSSTRSYMTVEVKAALVEKLNVSFD